MPAGLGASIIEYSFADAGLTLDASRTFFRQWIKEHMKIAHRFNYLSSIGPAYLVGGSVRDHILNRPSNDHDFAVPGNARAFAEKVATQLGVRMIEIGKNNKTIYRVVSGNDTIDFSPIEGKSIENDLKTRDFTVNGLGYDLRSERIIDPVGAVDDMKTKTIRLISQDAVLADPLRMLRAFRFAAVLGFEIAPQTLTVINKQSHLIAKSAGERVRAEMFKIMEVERSFPYIEQMSQAGLLTKIIPELEPCRGCPQNKIHGCDVFEHTMRTYEEIEMILSPPQADAVLWPEFAKPINSYLEQGGRKVLLKWAALLHDLGKPQTRHAFSVIDATGRIRFLRHEDKGAHVVQDICTRLRMSGQNRSYVTLIVQKHLRPLLLFDVHQRGSLTSKGIVRFVRKYQDDILGLLIHSVADQRAKRGERSESLEAFLRFLEKILITYFSDLKPKMGAPRLMTGHDLIKHLNLTPSKLFGRLLQKVEEARLNGEIRTKKEAIELVARLLELEGDAGIEPATPSSGGLCSIR